MSEAQALFSVLRQSADAGCVAAMERLVRDAPDYRLNRINVLDLPSAKGSTRSARRSLHAARIGVFEMSWNVLCPGCGGVLGANASLKSVRSDEYHCALCRGTSPRSTRWSRSPHVSPRGASRAQSP
jgi:hypothetical protein